MTDGPQSTFVFADLAGYTAVTEAHGDEEAADLAAAFYEYARRLLETCDGEEVKLIGDELMARIDDPAAAIQFAIELSHHSARRHEHLAVRVGLHHGPAVQRGDDWFGATVNVAARVAGLAKSGEVVTTVETARAAGDIEGISYQPRGEAKLKNVRQMVSLVTIECDRDMAELVRDPVCHMLLDPTRTTERVEWRGVGYWFCSGDCRDAFLAEPEGFL
jgi:class 3 adenylate cyclase